MEQVLKCFDCDYRGNSKTFEETEDNKHKCPKCKSTDNYVLSQVLSF